MKSNIVKIIYIGVNVIVLVFIIVAMIYGRDGGDSTAIKAAQSNLQSLEIKLAYKEQAIVLQAQVLDASRSLLDTASTRSEVIEETAGHKKNLASLEALEAEREELKSDLSKARREFHELLDHP